MNKMKYEVKSYYKSIHEVNFDKLKKMGIKLIIIDLDNTLGTVKERVISKEKEDLILELKKDFTVVVASNNSRIRVSLFLHGICDYICLALKPSKRLYRIIKRRYHLDSKDCAIIGDQFVTDIRLGNKVGFYTILVDPIGKDGKVSFFNRLIEKRIKDKIQFKDGEYFEKD